MLQQDDFCCGRIMSFRINRLEFSCATKVTQDRFYNFFVSQSLTYILGKGHLIHAAVTGTTQHKPVKNPPTVAHDA